MCVLIYGILSCLVLVGSVLQFIQLLGQNAGLAAFIYLIYVAGYGATVLGFFTGYCGKKSCGNWLMFYVVILMMVLAVIVYIVLLIMGAAIGQVIGSIVSVILVDGWMAAVISSYAKAEGG